jgi:aspartate/methionine/tyrosine aminotransferase
MHWAKLHSTARYNLATSGVANFPLGDLGVDFSQVDVNGTNAYGYEPLLQKIGTRYHVAPRNVVSAMGTSFANYLALAAATEPGDEILVEQPTYDPILGAAHYLGLEITRFVRRPEDNFAIDLNDLAQKITPRTRVIALCNLHNPSGSLIPDSMLAEIARLAQQNGAHVLVDEVYREMLFESEPRSAFHLDPERFIITNSLTKAYGLSGLRCGWVLAPPELAARMWRIHDVHAATNPYITEWLSAVAFEKLAQIAARMSKMLEENRNLLRDFLESRDDLDYFWPEYGTIVFPSLRHGTVEQMCDFLRREHEVSVVPGSFFETPDRFRMGVGTPTELVRAALEQLGAGLDRYKASLQTSAAR